MPRLVLLLASAVSFVLRAVFGLGLVLYLILGYAPRPHLPDLPGRLERGQIVWQGRARRYLVYVPRHLSPGAPLVMVLHGYLMDGAMMRRFTAYDFDTLAERDGFVVAYPDAYDRNWNDCHRPGLTPNASAHVDDVGFLEALVGRLAIEERIDPQRVLAFGYSNGADMALRLAQIDPAPIAAAVAVATNLPRAGDSICPEEGRTAPVLFVNGTADPLNPYAGGLVSVFGFSPRGIARSAVQSAEALARRNGLSASRERVVTPGERGGLRVVRRDWMTGGRPFIGLVTVEGGGHTVPQPGFDFPPILGPTAHDFDAAEASMAFFAVSDGANAHRQP